MKCSALPLLSGTGANKMTPLHVGSSYTHDFGFYSKGNASATHQSAWAGSLKPQIAWQRGGCTPFEPQLTRSNPPLKFPHTRYLGQRAAEKPSNFLAIFMVFSLTPITSIWSAS